jgi:hypothetical protein
MLGSKFTPSVITLLLGSFFNRLNAATNLSCYPCATAFGFTQLHSPDPHLLLVSVTTGRNHRMRLRIRRICVLRHHYQRQEEDYRNVQVQQSLCQLRLVLMLWWWREGLLAAWLLSRWDTSTCGNGGNGATVVLIPAF